MTYKQTTTRILHVTYTDNNVPLRQRLLPWHTTSSSPYFTELGSFEENHDITDNFIYIPGVFLQLLILCS